jgi:hypothetical protein
MSPPHATVSHRRALMSHLRASRSRWGPLERMKTMKTMKPMKSMKEKIDPFNLEFIDDSF